jgi:hypothetical protein
MPQWYTLDRNNQPVFCGTCNGQDNFAAWAQMHGDQLLVAHTWINKHVSVKTIFLGEDVGAGSSGSAFLVYKPVLFRSKVYGGLLDGQERFYTEWQYAKDGHDSLVNAVKASRYSVSNCLNWMKRRGSQIWNTILSAWRYWSRL